MIVQVVRQERKVLQFSFRSRPELTLLLLYKGDHRPLKHDIDRRVQRRGFQGVHPAAQFRLHVQDNNRPQKPILLHDLHNVEVQPETGKPLGRGPPYQFPNHLRIIRRKSVGDGEQYLRRRIFQLVECQMAHLRHGLPNGAVPFLRNLLRPGSNDFGHPGEWRMCKL